MMNIANQLTVLRMALIPVFMFFLLSDLPGARWIAAGLFIFASLTDFVDGYLARKLNLITNFGKFMDPLADKLLVTAALLCFIQLGEVSSWIVMLIIAREFIVSIFRAIAASEGIVIAASWWGKLKTNVQMFAIILILFRNWPLQATGWPVGDLLMYLAAILTVVSGFDYIYKNRAVLK